MKLTLGFSPCPNDTFIFDALVHGRIETEGLEFDYSLSDIEELNRKALSGEYDMTKLSCHAFPLVAGTYRILDSGAALSYGNGPLLISKRHIQPADINDKVIAIPGIHTTANLLFTIAWPEAKNKKVYLFSDIEGALLNDEVDAGLIIHETRFTYEKKGLQKIADMGEYWYGLTGLPVPLGLIVINKRISAEVGLKINRVLRRSIEYAKNDPAASSDFVSSNAKEMESAVRERHIKLYVNDFTIDLGKTGRAAIRALFSIAGEKGITPYVPEDIFVTESQT